MNHSMTQQRSMGHCGGALFGMSPSPPSDSLLNSGQYYHLSKFWHEHFPLFTPSPVEALDLRHSLWNTVSIMKDS